MAISSIVQHQIDGGSSGVVTFQCIDTKYNYQGIPIIIERDTLSLGGNTNSKFRTNDSYYTTLSYEIGKYQSRQYNMHDDTIYGSSNFYNSVMPGTACHGYYKIFTNNVMFKAYTNGSTINFIYKTDSMSGYNTLFQYNGYPTAYSDKTYIKVWAMLQGGGGGGASDQGGGGGSGAFIMLPIMLDITSTTSFNTGFYYATVGAGGSGGAYKTKSAGNAGGTTRLKYYTNSYTNVAYADGGNGGKTGSYKNGGYGGSGGSCGTYNSLLYHWPTDLALSCSGVSGGGQGYSGSSVNPTPAITTGAFDYEKCSFLNQSYRSGGSVPGLGGGGGASMFGDGGKGGASGVGGSSGSSYGAGGGGGTYNMSATYAGGNGFSGFFGIIF